MPVTSPEHSYYTRVMNRTKDFQASHRPPNDWRERDSFNIGTTGYKVLKIKGDPIARAKRKLAEGQGRWTEGKWNFNFDFSFTELRYR